MLDIKKVRYIGTYMTRVHTELLLGLLLDIAEHYSVDKILFRR